ncbi:MAG: RDD family protein [Planctomycetes bacterium]|nr:RDD family protein [Planctomycetota bacterium]
MTNIAYSAQFTDATRPVPQADRVGTMLHMHRVPLPEDVEAAFEVANPVSRVWATLIDLGIIVLGCLVLMLVFVVSTISALMSGSSPLLTWTLLILLFMFFNVGYFFLFEGMFSGQTPGKSLLRLRVITETGQEIGPREGITRAFMRLVVIGPMPALLVIGYFNAEWLMAMAPFSALGLLMFIDRKGRSLSDFVAGTMVISQRPPTLATNRPHVPLYFQLPHHYFPLSHIEMSKLTPDDYVRLEEFGSRLSTISNAARQQAAMAAAAALATRMGYGKPVDPPYAELFLFEMHAALKQQLQQLYPDLYQ